MTLRLEIFTNIPELKTDRLILRKVLLTDANDIYEYASDPGICRYLNWLPHSCIEDSRDYIYQVIQRYMDGEPGTWGIELSSENKLIGTISFIYWDEINRVAETGFALSRKYWNQGIMTEALWKILSFGFTRMNLNRIEARTMMDNTASQRVLTKVGMSFEGVLREQMLVREHFSDMKIYSILRKEFFE